MLNFLKIAWWKWLGAFLVLFSLIIGLATPLAPGITETHPATSLSGDTVRMDVKTVNAHFKSKPEGIQAALSLEKHFLVKAIQIQALNENSLNLIFILPGTYSPGKGKVDLADLELATDYDGLLVLRQALEIKPNPDTTKILNLKTKVNLGLDTKLKIKNLGPEWFSFPNREILYESVRNLFFHVAMWPSMFLLFLISVIYSIRYLRNGNEEYDRIAAESVQVGLVFATVGIITGSFWAKFTWGDWWPNDAKLNGTAIAILFYFAYIVFRNSFAEEQQRAKFSAVYNVFAFPIMFVTIMILPRITDSLHPGNGGNPAFSNYDMDSHLRIGFYPACLGWVLIGLWILDLRLRIRKLEYRIEEI